MSTLKLITKIYKKFHKIGQWFLTCAYYTSWLQKAQGLLEWAERIIGLLTFPIPISTRVPPIYLFHRLGYQRNIFFKEGFLYLKSNMEKA